MNSKISKLKDLGCTFAESKFCSGFMPLMELWKLRNSELCLAVPKIKEASLEAMEEEVAPETEPVQHIESASKPAATFDPQDSIMEEAPTQMVVSEASASQPISVSFLRRIEQIKDDNSKVNEPLDKKHHMFQLILSRLPPPSQNP